MITINFRDAHGGESGTVTTEVGPTLMEVATMNNVAGVIAECGGGASCGTCHVYIDERWSAMLPVPEPEESDLIEFLDGVQPNSRLACQLVLEENLDGMIVTTPLAEG